MFDFEIQRCTRRCAKTDRELQPGETFYSVLSTEGADVVRRDYGQEAWEGPPDGCLGWWKSQVPGLSAKKANWAPNDVIRDYFQQLGGQAGKEDVRYVLALLMVRRRIVRLEETEKDEAGRETLVLFCPRDEAEYRVPALMPDEQRAREIQEELTKLLHADGA
jgi:uncharacterized protein YbaR (Trm112 family)